MLFKDLDGNEIKEHGKNRCSFLMNDKALEILPDEKIVGIFGNENKREGIT